MSLPAQQGTTTTIKMVQVPASHVQRLARRVPIGTLAMFVCQVHTCRQIGAVPWFVMMATTRMTPQRRKRVAFVPSVMIAAASASVGMCAPNARKKCICPNSTTCVGHPALMDSTSRGQLKLGTLVKNAQTVVAGAPAPPNAPDARTAISLLQTQHVLPFAQRVTTPTAP